MSSDTPDAIYPVMLVEDRYRGVYSGGRWWAVANGDDPFEGMTRLQWLMENGPGADDVTCAVFWNRPPPWIAAADSPDEAIARLIANPDVDSDSWLAPAWEDDPRATGFLSESSK